MTSMMLAAAAPDVAVGLTGSMSMIGVGLVGLGGALGVGLAGAKAAEAIGRNPGTFGKVFTVALIAMALAEGLAILAFFVVART
ncbi:MAG TPA: ATPase [Verrucomicrobiae bacterium]|nr:ATPase [Verrucomicrobiae bacterium]